MATGLSTAAASDLLDALTAGYTYVQLHDGDPGSDGTDNIADETTRIQVTDWTGTGAARSNDNVLTWDAVTVSGGTQTYSYISLWSLAALGAFGYSGPATANPVSDGDDFEIRVGELDVSLPVATD